MVPSRMTMRQCAFHLDIPYGVIMRYRRTHLSDLPFQQVGNAKVVNVQEVEERMRKAGYRPALARRHPQAR